MVAVVAYSACHNRRTGVPGDPDIDHLQALGAQYGIGRPLLRDGRRRGFGNGTLVGILLVEPERIGGADGHQGNQQQRRRDDQRGDLQLLLPGAVGQVERIGVRPSGDEDLDARAQGVEALTQWIEQRFPYAHA